MAEDWANAKHGKRLPVENDEWQNKLEFLKNSLFKGSVCFSSATECENNEFQTRKQF